MCPGVPWLAMQVPVVLGDDVRIDAYGGSMAGDTLMAAGLVRIAEAARQVTSGDADRALAQASSGPCLQQNLVCLLEGE